MEIKQSIVYYLSDPQDDDIDNDDNSMMLNRMTKVLQQRVLRGSSRRQNL